MRWIPPTLINKLYLFSRKLEKVERLSSFLGEIVIFSVCKCNVRKVIWLERSEAVAVFFQIYTLCFLRPALSPKAVCLGHFYTKHQRHRTVNVAVIFATKFLLKIMELLHNGATLFVSTDFSDTYVASIKVLMTLTLIVNKPWCGRIYVLRIASSNGHGNKTVTYLSYCFRLSIFSMYPSLS